MTSWRLILRRRWGARRRTEHAQRTEEAVRALMDAADSANAPGIAALLSENAILTIDAGSHAIGGAPSPLASGPVAAARQLLSLLDSFADRRLAQHDINGAAGILVRSDERVVGVIAVDMRANGITHVWAIVNPDKLAHWNRF
jgi:RNA polymerase sigma-70 factor (ECF subfamily)